MINKTESTMIAQIWSLSVENSNSQSISRLILQSSSIKNLSLILIEIEDTHLAFLGPFGKAGTSRSLPFVSVTLSYLIFLGFLVLRFLLF